jgi:crotonobetainyl-CoA:carnitine CoA-transferase CaiB-like acyl-CoA transferase
VVVENFRPGVMDRLGLGYAHLSHGRDDLIYASLTGFGREGPYAAKSAYDTVIQAYAGLAANQADPGTGEPKFLNQTAADKVTALVAAQAITAALFARERGAGGQHVELSMLDAVVSFLWADAAGNELLLESDHSRPSSFVANFKPFRFSDGWGICTPTSDADFAGMCRAMGVEGYDDPRIATIAQRNKHRELTRGVMARVYEAAATMTTAEAMRRMEAERVPCGVVLTPAELSGDAHARAIGLLVDDVHPVAGPIRQPRHPTRFSATPAVLGGPAPMLGQHTDEVLDELGLGDHTTGLRAEGVVA